LIFKKGQNMAKCHNRLISGKPFQKGKIWMIWPLKWPNGNHVFNTLYFHQASSLDFYLLEVWHERSLDQRLSGHGQQHRSFCTSNWSFNDYVQYIKYTCDFRTTDIKAVSISVLEVVSLSVCTNTEAASISVLLGSRYPYILISRPPSCTDG